MDVFATRAFGLPSDQLGRSRVEITMKNVRFMTVAEVAEVARTSEDYVREALRTGALIGKKLSRKVWRVPVENVEHWLGAK
jgi:excisionase family DNA binding protein